MACDRFVYFATVPSREDIGKISEDFLGAFLVSSEWASSRWTFLLVGHKSFPFRRIDGISPALQRAHEEEAQEERWIEVFIGDDNIDVITRRQDPAVNALAEGLAKCIARRWDGRLEMG